MADKSIYLPNDDTQYTPSVDYNQWLKRLDTQLNEPTYKNSIKVPKVAKPTNKKCLYFSGNLKDGGKGRERKKKTQQDLIKTFRNQKMNIILQIYVGK